MTDDAKRTIRELITEFGFTAVIDEVAEAAFDSGTGPDCMEVSRHAGQLKTLAIQLEGAEKNL